MIIAITVILNIIKKRKKMKNDSSNNNNNNLLLLLNCLKVPHNTSGGVVAMTMKCHLKW